MPKVVFKNTGDEVQVDDNASLKDVSKTWGWPIAYGCEDGVCGTCIVKAESGKENLTEMGETEAQTLDMMCMKDGDHRLACQCKVKGDVTIEGM